MKWLALVVLAGCGRLSFDPVASSDAGADATSCGVTVNDPASDDATSMTCGGGPCSLRGAIVQTGGTHAAICIPDGMTIALTLELEIAADTTIVGQGPSARVQGTTGHRAFHVAHPVTLELDSLDLSNGKLVDEGGAAVAVEAGGSLIADRVVFHDNDATYSSIATEGGAITAIGATRVEIARSTFRNNQVHEDTPSPDTGRGGAVALLDQGQNGTYSITDTTFDSNVTVSVGGALYLAIPLGRLTFERNTLVGNRSNSGAAIDLNCASTGTITIRNSTFVNNVPAESMLGVIYVCDSAAITLDYVTIAGNGGPMARFDNVRGTMSYRGVAMQGVGYDLCTGNVDSTSLGFNVVSSFGACSTSASDRTGDPVLAALADNGGPTKTMALQAGSLAIDTGDTSCPATDQRGLLRPARGSCDAGAYELQ